MGEINDPNTGDNMEGLALELSKMNDNFKALLALNKTMSSHLESIDSEADETGETASRSSKSLYKITDRIPILGKVFRKVGSEMSKTFTESFKLQERALARGLDLGSLRDQMQPMTDQMSGFFGGITDSITALEIATTAYESGIRTNNTAVGMLALQAKLTGGDHKKLLKQLGQNTAGMGMNDSAMTSLAKTTQVLSQNFGMTGNELMQAMKGLSSDLNDLAAIGIGPDILEGTATLAAALSPGMSEMAPDIMKALTSGGNMVQNAMLGGADAIGAVLAKGNGPADTINAVMIMGKRAQEISDQYTKGSMHSMFAMKQATSVFGKQMPLYARAYEHLQQAAKDQKMGIHEYTRALVAEQKIKTDFQDTWENFKNKIFNPIKTIFLEVSTWFMKLIMEFKPLAGILGGLIAVVGVVGGVMAAMAAFSKLTVILPLIGAGITATLKGIGLGMRAMGRGGAAGAGGVAAFGAALVPVALSIAAVAAAIGVAGAGLGILFHGFEGLGGESTKAQATSSVRVGSASRQSDAEIRALNAQTAQLTKLNNSMDENNEYARLSVGNTATLGSALRNTLAGTEIRDFPYVT